MKQTNITQLPDNATVTSQLVTAPRYGSKRDVAAMIQMSTRSVDNFCAAGCPHLKLGKRRVRFDMDEVRKWLAETYRTQRRAGKGLS